MYTFLWDTRYLCVLDIKMPFKEIEMRSEKRFKRLVKDKKEKAAFLYLQNEKQKQTKIASLE